ncbi:hypothetical protein VMCG_02169 [Cytospora schulzeri]|uniref:Uncharacterized protein n=1 Tax=Cytospora schulzeri TaxID=448051 RepID=A0A423X222_9PEZI|nr:hypothetical protein VMCG_02169 [Valsa malicola]
MESDTGRARSSIARNARARVPLGAPQIRNLPATPPGLASFAGPNPIPVGPLLQPQTPRQPPIVLGVPDNATLPQTGPQVAAGGGGGGGGGDPDSSPSDNGDGRGGPGRNPLGPPPDGIPRQVPVDEIRAEWAELEALIAQFVDDCLPKSMPLDFPETKREELTQYQSFCSPPDIADWMLVFPQYAKYMFQARIWTVLYTSIFQGGATFWAGNDMFEEGVPLGAGEAMSNIAGELFLVDERPKTFAARQAFLLGRPGIVNFVQNHLISQDRHEEVVQEVAGDILYCFDPYFAPEFLPDDADDDLSPLRSRALQLVRKAREIDLHIRAADGMTWPFWGIPGERLWSEDFGFEAVKAHEFEGSMPWQSFGSVGPMSTVSLCVVPGLTRLNGRMGPVETVPELY